MGYSGAGSSYGSPLVPSADSTSNTTERDVVGNKTDAAQTTVGTTRSVMAYIKGLISLVTKPAADSTNNVTPADVIGSKDDAAQTTVGTTRSLMAYVKTLVNRTGVATADTTNNTNVSETVGNKTDAAQTTVGTTRSIMAYVKGLLGYVMPRVSTTGHDLIGDFTAVTAPAGGAHSAYVQARAAAGSAAVELTGVLIRNVDATDSGAGRVRVATGGAGSEVQLCIVPYSLKAGESIFILLPRAQSIGATTRVAISANEFTGGLAIDLQVALVGYT